MLRACMCDTTDISLDPFVLLLGTVRGLLQAKIDEGIPKIRWFITSFLALFQADRQASRRKNANMNEKSHENPQISHVTEALFIEISTSCINPLLNPCFVCEWEICRKRKESPRLYTDFIHLNSSSCGGENVSILVFLLDSRISRSRHAS